MRIEVRPLPTLEVEAIQPLIRASLAEGFHFVERLAREYQSGANRFDGAGEGLFAAREGDRIVGVCGLNRDPYMGDARTGRVRHLYVLRESRQRGVGRQLVEAVIEAAAGPFDVLTLRTENPDAARLYRSLGFSDAPRFAQATHWRPL